MRRSLFCLSVAIKPLCGWYTGEKLFFPCRQLQPCFVGSSVLARWNLCARSQRGPCVGCRSAQPALGRASVQFLCGVGNAALLNVAGLRSHKEFPVSTRSLQDNFSLTRNHSISFPLVWCVYLAMLEDHDPFPTTVSCSALSSLMLLQKCCQQHRELSLLGGESWWGPTEEMMGRDELDLLVLCWGRT